MEWRALGDEFQFGMGRDRMSRADSHKKRPQLKISLDVFFMEQKQSFLLLK